MIREFNIDNDRIELIKLLQKAFQSCNINFLIGSGCSFPSLQILGSIEQEIDNMYKKGKDTEADKKLVSFLKPFVDNTKKLIEDHLEDNDKKTLKNYQDFIKAIDFILFERKCHILHKQATIFSTNYDMFIEKAIEPFSDSLVLNDGFCRNPSLKNTFGFSAKSFFNTVSNTGYLYKYQVEIPTVNLIKLHGSLNWKICEGNVSQSLEHIGNDNLKGNKDFIEQFALVLPREDKFRETTINQIYYDLLRIYSNELDKENTLLIAEGFSFADKHIFNITKRALKNPTLLLVIFCYKEDGLQGFRDKFSSSNNVVIVFSKRAKIEFCNFIELLSEVLPKREEKPIYTVRIEETQKVPENE